MSSLIVDAQLDAGAFGIKTDSIEESTLAAGVDMADGIKTDIIEESTAGAGVKIFPPLWILLDLSASNNIRTYDDSQITREPSTAYEKLKTLTIPAHYKQGQTCRVTSAIKSQGGVWAYVKVYVNGVAAGEEHKTGKTTFVTFTDDITVGGGDKVEMWAHVDSGASLVCGLFTVGGDDAMPDVFYGGEAWP